jgi:hypothetical protein
MLEELLTIMAINFTNFTDDVFGWMMTPYIDQFGSAFWLVIFATVIAFTYVVTHNLTATVAAIFVTFAAFGSTSVFLGDPQYSFFFSIISMIGVAGTILVLYLKRTNF